jgi:hypothetical protein
VLEQVRGAYVKLERARAAELGYEDPIWPNIDGTHTNYDRCLDAILDEVRHLGCRVQLQQNTCKFLELVDFVC